jgi:hypothetical protein
MCTHTLTLALTGTERIICPAVGLTVRERPVHFACVLPTYEARGACVGVEVRGACPESSAPAVLFRVLGDRLRL